MCQTNAFNTYRQTGFGLFRFLGSGVRERLRDSAQLLFDRALCLGKLLDLCQRLAVRQGFCFLRRTALNTKLVQKTQREPTFSRWIRLTRCCSS